MNTTSATPAAPAASPARRALPPEKVKILQGCRDMAVERLVAAFSAMLEKVGDMLIERSGKTDIREEQQSLLDARVALMRDRGGLMAEFEKRLRSLDGPHAAADTAAKLRADRRDERGVVAGVLRRVEIDELHVCKRRELRDPPGEVVARKSQPLALYELHDASALQVDGGNQHSRSCPCP